MLVLSVLHVVGESTPLGLGATSPCERAEIRKACVGRGATQDRGTSSVALPDIPAPPSALSLPGERGPCLLRVAEIYECLSSQPRLQSQEWGKTLRGKGLVQVLKKTVSCFLVLGPTFSPRWKEGATGKT